MGKDLDLKNSASESVKLEVSDFVHLHNHTHYSVLDGMTKIDELVEKTKEYGMEAVAVTDHGTMSGLLDIYKTAKASGIKPILGIEAYVAARKHTDKDPQFDKTRYHLTLMAMNNIGYQNLMKLSTIANIDGYYYKPRLDHQLLEKYAEGIICLSGCSSSEISVKIKNNDYKGALKLTKWYHKVFGDRFYLEMQDHGHPLNPAPFKDQIVVNQGLQKLAKELDIPLVITCDGHYLNFEDRQTHEILLCVGTGAYLSDERRMSLKDFELYLTDPKDIIKRWGADFPEAILNTKRLADRCQVEIELGKILIPDFPVPSGETEKSFLDNRVYRGSLIRYLGYTPEQADNEPLAIAEIRKLLPKEVLERLDYELEVIDRMHYNGYFLIVHDFIDWGKSQGILFGPGRGSAAGAIVAYCLAITDLDPLKYDLLFERFLNPDRISMPDIDIDIQDNRRDEVVQYCVEKYGAARVSNIVTFGKMAARSAVRDVARVLEVPYTEANRLSQMIPSLVQGRHVPLSKSVMEDPDLKKEYNSNPRSKEVIDFAKRLEGTIRSHGVHACGVVIAPDDLVKYIPLERSQKGVIATQFPMGQVEDLGLLKMDFLGLSNLSIINNALRIIRKVYKVDIDVSTLSLDDEETYKLFQRGDTTGVFQLESAGMKKYLKELVPSKFEDIIAMGALYRPGPMQFISSFIKRKHGQEKITYLHPKMEAALKNTYGIMVYQEQFMQISKDLAGFTAGQADTLRKAVGKKKLDLMAEIKPLLIAGALKNSDITQQKIELFWDQLQEFANYCFNKSHAACYALIAYWTGYLKAHYPHVFMAALMTEAKDDTDRLAILIGEAKKAGIQVMAPDINESFVDFAIVPGTNAVRIGMAGVKGVGEAIVEELIEVRKTGGKFVSIADFAKRMAGKKFNKKAWEALIKTGAFDQFGRRSDLLDNLDLIQTFMSKSAKDTISGQVDLFAGSGEGSMPELEIKASINPATERDQLQWERELLGLYISAHPLDKFEHYLSEQTIDIGTILSEHDGKSVLVGGTITAVREFVTKKNTKMAFVTLENKLTSIDVIVFPNTYEKYLEQIIVDKIVTINGRINSKDRDGSMGEPKLMASDINELTDEMVKAYQPTFRKKKRMKIAKQAQDQFKEAAKPLLVTKPVISETISKLPKTTLYVKIIKPEDQSKLKQLKRFCELYPGSEPVILVLGDDKTSALRLPFRVDTSGGLIEELEVFFSADCVKLKTA